MKIAIVRSSALAKLSPFEGCISLRAGDLMRAVDVKGRDLEVAAAEHAVAVAAGKLKAVRARKEAADRRLTELVAGGEVTPITGFGDSA
jgi:hypothetical protein